MTFSHAVEAAHKIKPLFPGDDGGKIVSLSGIASAQAKAGDKQQSLATFEKAMKVAQNVRNVDFRASALRDIGAAQAKGGLKPQALATLKQGHRTGPEAQGCSRQGIPPWCYCLNSD